MQAKLVLVVALILVAGSEAVAAGVTEAGKIGADAESWERDFPLVVSDDARDIVWGLAVKLEHGTVGFELIDPDGNVVTSSSGGKFTLGPAIALGDGKPGAYQVRVKANGAAEGTWKFTAASIAIASSSVKYLIGGALMVLVATASVVYWRLKSGALWRWFAAGALLWVIGVAMKIGFAVLMNSLILTWLERHFGHMGYLILGCVYIGLLTGVFEVAIVGLAALFSRGMAAEARNAVAVGVGAGAVEAALLGAGLLGTAMVALSRGDNNTMAGALLMSGATPVAWLAAPVERVIAILCHVAARTLALLGVARRSWWPFWAGFGLLSLVDTIAAWAFLSGTMGTFSLWWLELSLVPIAVASVPLTVWAVRHWPREACEGQAAIPG